MTSYEELGLRPIINASTTFTAIGGSLMPNEVLDAMRSAAGSFVDMHELHRAVGRRLAEITRNEAAYVTSGCASAIILALLGMRNGGNPGVLTAFPGRDLAPSEVIMHSAHRIPYDATFHLAGITIKQIGNTQQTFDWELDSAISPETLAVIYVAGSHLPQVALSLEQTVEIAHARGIPVIVDAAAQLPPVSNLWHFTRDLGADLVAFSGGKGLRGPQASGLLLGSAQWVEAARSNGSPYQRWARAMKAGKEEIMGLLAAVERYVALDHDAEHAEWVATVSRWGKALQGIPGVNSSYCALNEAGQPVPRLHLEVADHARAEEVLRRLDQSDPRVSVMPDRRNGVAHGLWLGPDMLEEGQEALVERVIIGILDATSYDPEE